MNIDRQVVAHSPFEEAEGGVRFTRTVAKGELKIEPLVWPEKEFGQRLEKLQRLEAELKQIVGELKPKRIKWPEAAYAAPLPAHLAPAFFMAWGDVTDRSDTPLAARGERASQEESKK
jgi:hypothetical protein